VARETKAERRLLNRFLVAVYANPYAMLGLATLFWAGNVIASRLAVGHVSPMALTTLRWAGVLILLPLLLRGLRPGDLAVLRARAGYVLTMGALGFTTFNAAYYLAAHFTTAVNIGIIQGSIPGLVFLLAYFVRGTPARARQIGGMMATLLGVAVVATRGDIAAVLALSFNVGDLLMLGACLVYAVYTVRLPDRPVVGGLSFFAGLAVAAFVTSLPLLGTEIAAGLFLAPTPFGWAVVAYCAIFPSVLSQIFFIRGVELVGPGRAGLFVNLVPVFAAVLAVAILGERFHTYHGVALALVLGGLLFAEHARTRTGPPPAAG
jgi:drug/metabolite transporter (DMT)-like permease